MNKDDKRSSRPRGRGRKEKVPRVPRKNLNADENVPMLTFGAASNFTVFREALSVACLEKYGNLGRIIKEDGYYKVPEVNRDDYQPPEEEREDARIAYFYDQDYLEALKLRRREIGKMDAQKPSLYAYLMSKLSPESINQIERDLAYPEFSEAVDPLGLWRAIKEAHMVTTTSKDSRVRRYNAMQEYSRLRQGPYQSLIDYKRQFDLRYKAYLSTGNKEKDAEDQAMDFLNGLDTARYGDFVVEYLNSVTYGAVEPPSNVEEIYNYANTRLEVKRGSRIEGASYTTIEHNTYKPHKERRPNKDKSKGKRNKKGGESQSKPDDKDASEDKKPKTKGKNRTQGVRRCFRCGSTDHLIKDCPYTDDDQDESEDDSGHGANNRLAGMTYYKVDDVCPLNGLTLVEHHKPDPPCAAIGSESSDSDLESSSSEDNQTTSSSETSSSSEFDASSEEQSLGDYQVSQRLVATTGAPTHPWEIVLDNGSQVNIVHPRFLTNFKRSQGKFSGLQGAPLSTEMCGLLPGFFYCLVSDSTRVSVLSQADVEDTHPVSYDPGVSYTVHMGDRDVVFQRRDKLYVGDFSDWVRAEYRDDPLALSAMTVAEREHLYTRRERRKAIETRDFIKNAGYPSEREAVAMARDGNLKNLPYEAVDIKRHYDIYGPSPAYLRGKTTNRKVSSSVNQVDNGLKDQRRDQTLTSDVMHVMGFRYLVSVAEPLGLTVSVLIKKRDIDGLGVALMSHVSLLDSHGFRVTRIITDPQKGMESLRGKLGPVELDIVGAGDHLNKVDAKIRRLKELMRAVIAGLPYTLPAARANDLVIYATNRINARRTSALNDNVAPRVKFTGRRIDYLAEYKAGFGDYVEAYNPRVQSSTMQERTEPCIALYPAGNVTGSWILWSLRSQRYVRRGNFKTLPMPYTVIKIMNEAAGVDGIGTANEVALAQENAPDPTQVAPEEVMVEPNVPNERARRTGESEADREAGPDSAPEPLTFPVIRADTGSGNTGVTDEGVVMTQLTVKKGIEKHGKIAVDAIVKEFNQLFFTKKALRPISRDEARGMKAKERVRSSMFLKEKYDGNNEFEKLKGRLVSDGSTQDKTLYPNLSSPTAKLESIFIVLELATRRKMRRCKMDIGGAYLNAHLYQSKGDDVILMIIPRQLTQVLVENLPSLRAYVDEKSGTMWVQVLKAMYGLVQSASLWYDALVKFLTSLGFVTNPLDKCVLMRRDGESCTIIVLYVDDILLVTTKRKMIEWVHRKLEGEYETVEMDVSDSFTYLGMVLSTEANGMLSVSMEGYTANIVRDYETLYKVKEVTTPATLDLFVIGNKNERLGPKDTRLFHRFVAKLLYLCKRARIDVQLAVLFLCTRVKEPNKGDKRKLDRVIGFLKRTVDRKRRIRGTGDATRVRAYIDSAFSAHDDGKGHSGMVVMWGDTCVLDTCRKQKIATKDSTEAEIVGMSDNFERLEWVHDFITSLGWRLNQPIIYQDNMSAITLVMGVPRRLRTKHMTARNAVLHQAIVEKNEAGLEHKSTKLMIADPLTKPITGEAYHLMMAVVMGWMSCSSLDRLIHARNKGVRSE